MNCLKKNIGGRIFCKTSTMELLVSPVLKLRCLVIFPMPLPTPNCPWSDITINIIIDLPESEGKTVILVIIDRFSCSLCLIPLESLPTAFGLAEIMFNHVFRFSDLPEDVISDLGSQFTSQVWHNF